MAGIASRIPFYSKLNAKQRQHVHMVAGGLTVVSLLLFISGFVGGPTQIKSGATAEMPKPRPMGGVPGQAVDAKDAWVGGAGKDIVRMRDDLRQASDAAKRQADEQARINNELMTELKALRSAPSPSGVAATAPASPAASAGSVNGGNSTPVAAAAHAPKTTQGMPSAVSGTSFPAQPRGNRLPGPATAAQGTQAAYPPGQPIRSALAGPDSAVGTSPDFAVPRPPVMMRVSLNAKGEGDTAADTAVSATGAGVAATNGPGGPLKQRRRVDSFLPVSFTRALLLGGLAAPTGGQSQSNPVPVLLRLMDAAMLPNSFRSQVKDCLVVGEGYGDQSAERAYIRTTLLSCVLQDGTVMEMPIKGSVFGEDGMNGMSGHLVTKQGQILTNALLAGIASGIGNGLATSSQTVATSPLGSTTTQGTDTSSILKAGLGSGVGRALDRLSLYYISLAEKTFPVIEIQPGRIVDIVIQQGVQLEAALSSGAGQSAAALRDKFGDRAALLRSVRGDEEE